MSDDLYLRTYTKSKDSLQWSNAESIGLWEWLKASAAFSRQVLPGGIVIERGQVWVSLRNLEDRLRLSRMTISRYLKLWSEDGAIKVQKLGRKGTIVTLCNFDTYQVLGREGGTQTSQKPAKSEPKASRNQPLTKNPKNPKNPEPLDKPAEPGGSDAERFVEIWNGTAGVARCTAVTAKRAKHIKARAAETIELDGERLGWLDALERVAKAKFPLPCTRGSPDAWKPDADWILRPDSITRIIEGKYDWRKSDERNGSDRIGPGQRFDGEALSYEDAQRAAASSGF